MQCILYTTKDHQYKIRLLSREAVIMNKTAYQMTPTIKDLEQSNTSLKLYTQMGIASMKLSVCGFLYHYLVVHHLHFSIKIIYRWIKLSILHSFYIFIMLVNLSIRLCLETQKVRRKENREENKEEK